MKDDRPPQLNRERELSLKDLAHNRRDVPHLEAVQPYLAHSGLRVREEPGAERGEERSEKRDIWDDRDIWD